MAKENNHKGYSDDTKKSILKFIKNKGSFTRNDIQLKCGHNWVTIDNVLNDFLQEGKIKEIGKAGKIVLYSWK